MDLTVLRYRLAKLGKYAQRMVTWVFLGCGSHWWSDPGEKEFLRDSGSAVVGVAVARWLAQQGRRQVDNQGKQTRTPTLRITPEERNRIDTVLRNKRRTRS